MDPRVGVDVLEEETNLWPLPDLTAPSADVRLYKVSSITAGVAPVGVCWVFIQSRINFVYLMNYSPEQNSVVLNKGPASSSETSEQIYPTQCKNTKDHKAVSTF